MSSTGQKKPTSPMRPKEKLWIEPTQRYEAHRFLETSDDFRLADGRPLSHALLTDPNALVLKAHDANRARGDLRQLFTSGPDTVRQCIGCSLEQARTTISSAPVLASLTSRWS